MARVRVVGTVVIGGRELPVKRLTRIAPLLPRGALEATAEQLRVIAEETRELLIDRLMARRPQPPGVAVVARPARISKSALPTLKRAPLPMRPLTRRHVLRKLRNLPRLDGRHLVATGDLIRGIEVFKIQQKESGVAYIVRLARRKHRPDPSWGSGVITLNDLARVHEYGSAKHKIPARPLWRPTARDVRAAFVLLKPTIQAEALRKALRKIR